MLDLRKDLVIVDKYIRTSIAQFQSNVGEPSWIGVYSCPWEGWITLNFDTSKDLDEDNQYCLGLEYVDYSSFEFTSWRNTHSQLSDQRLTDKESDIDRGSYVSLIDHTGILISSNSDLGITKFDNSFFRMLVAATHNIKQESSTCKYIVEILEGSQLEII